MNFELSRKNPNFIKQNAKFIGEWLTSNSLYLEKSDFHEKIQYTKLKSKVLYIIQKQEQRK